MDDKIQEIIYIYAEPNKDWRIVDQAQANLVKVVFEDGRITFAVPVPKPPKEEKGGKTSGNYGHSGRPGKVGGSAPGGGAGSSDTAQFKYLNAKRSHLLEQSSAGKLQRHIAERLKASRPDATDDDVIQIVDVAMLEWREGNKDYVRRMLDRFGINPGDELLNEAAQAERQIDILIEREKWKIRDKWTAKDYRGGAGAIEPQDEDWDDKCNPAKVGLWGKTAKDVIDHIQNDFGVAIRLYDDNVDEATLHTELSSLAHALRVSPTFAHVFKKSVGTIEYRNDGSTAEAKYFGKGDLRTTGVRGTIRRVQGAYSAVWVHETGHALEDWGDFQSIQNVFSSGKRVSTYSWMNASESFAESFTAFVCGPKTYKSQIPEKFAYLDKLIGTVK